MSGLRIRRIVERAFRGVAYIDIDVPPAGLQVAGRNGGGKTSFIDGIRANLMALGVSKEAIRIGEANCEILIDMEHPTIGKITSQRFITGTGDRLDVKVNGESIKKPQTFLNGLLGTCAIDPLEILLEKDKKKRRKSILSALPATLTQEQLASWVDISLLPPGYESVLNLHGLEALTLIRQSVYDHRAKVNARVKEITASIDHKTRELPPKPAPPFAPVAEAERAANDAKAQHAAIVAHRQRAGSANARLDGQRAQIAELRAGATAAEFTMRPRLASELDAMLGMIALAETRVAQAKETLRLAEIDLAASKGLLAAAREDDARWTHEYNERVMAPREKASTMEAAIAATVDPGPSDAEVDAALKLAEAAAAEAERARKAAAFVTAKGEIDVLSDEQRALSEHAGKLTAVVDTLTNAAPAKLIAASDGIPGLSVDGEKLLLDGVDFDNLCGAEQMRLAIDIAKRANKTAKILIVDGLERIEPSGVKTFVAEATKGEYQLIATRVADGDVVMESIEIESGNGETSNG